MSTCAGSYLVESLQQLKTVYVYVTLGNITKQSDVQIYFKDDGALLIMMVGGQELVIPLGTYVDPSKYTMNVIEDKYIVLKIITKLQELSKSPVAANSWEEAFLGSSEKRSQILPRFQQLYCRFCSAQVTQGGFQKVLSLPSQNWLELSDLWTCEQGGFEAFPREEINSRPFFCFVGETYLMIHPANIVHNIVKKDEFATDHPEVKKVMKLDGRLCCSRCESPLGYFTSKGSTSFMLSKYQISTSAQSETPDNLFWNQTLENLCASELYYRCRSQSCARFFFIPHGSLRPLLLIRVLNWDSSIKIGQSTSMKTLMSTETQTADSKLQHDQMESIAGHSAPVLKMMYFTCTDPSEEQERLCASWEDDDSLVDNIFLAHEEIVEISRLLNISTLLFPPIYRHRSQFKIGFLRRCSFFMPSTEEIS